MSDELYYECISLLSKIKCELIYTLDMCDAKFGKNNSVEKF